MWLYVPSISATATEDLNSPSDPWAGYEPFVVLSGMPTQRPFSWRAWRKRAWITLLSGIRSKPSTVDRGVAEWISSLAASPANRGPLPERGGGIDDPRWIWPLIARVVADVEPRFVLLENVPGLNAANWRKSGLQYVLSDLADLGFDAEWGLLPASAVGAPHERERFWLVAFMVNACGDVRDRAWPAGAAPVLGGRFIEQADADRAGEDLAYTAGFGLRGRQRSGPTPELPTVAVSSSDVGDTVCEGLEGSPGPECADGDTRWSGFPPRPDDRDGWERWLAAGGPEPTLRRVSDGPPPGLADALHLGGNGLVPQCAAEAWRQLLARREVTL